jgi:hypothetical protein
MSRQSEKVAENMRQRVAKVASALILEIDKELRKSGTGTPVDTGHARRNWVPSVASPFTGIATSNAEHDAGVATVIAFKLEQGSVFLSNNVPYVPRLNLGWSTQAPAGFIEAAIDRADATIRSRYIDVRIDVTGAKQAISDASGARAAEGIASAYSPFGGDDD